MTQAAESAFAPQSPTVAPTIVAPKKPMNDFDVWSKIYAMRNGQIVLLYSIDEDGVKKMKDMREAAQTKTIFNDLSLKTLKYSTTNAYNSGAEKSVVVDSWGGFVEFAARSRLDLSGLTLSPEQKKFQYEFELQNRDLKGAKLDFSKLDGMDFSGTDFLNASMQQASLTNTTGKATNFSNVKGYQMDFSGSTYTEPSFTAMVAPRSIHVGTTYNLPKLDHTDWNSAHIVASRFLVKKNDSGRANVNISNALVAGSLFYGMDTDATPSPLQFSQAAFPGCCFFNLDLTPDNTAKKADFSPLALNDQRLSAAEQAYLKNFGQWLNSDRAMDGVKVSSDVRSDLDADKIYSMFSEIKYDENRIGEAPLFFSKGKVLNRTSFHECAAVDIVDTLPKKMAARLKVIDAPVIKPAVPAPAAPQAATMPAVPVTKNNALPIPAIDFDKDEISLQVQALKTASIADTLGIGSQLQAALIDTTTLVTSWAMNHLGRQPLRDEIDRLIGSIQDTSLAELMTPPPAPGRVEPEPAPPPQRKKSGLFSMFSNEEETPQQNTSWTPPPAPAAPVDKFMKIGPAMEAFPKALSVAIGENKADLANAEQVWKYLRTMEKAFTAYIDEMQTLEPTLEEENPDAASIAHIRLKSLEDARAQVTRLNQGMGEFVQTTAQDGAVYLWAQGGMGSVLAQAFTKASGLHELALAVAKNKDNALKDSRLAGMYSTFVGAETGKPADLLQTAFADIQKQMLDKLHDVDQSFNRMQTTRSAILNKLLSPA